MPGNFYDVDILVMGGDITGKLLIPIIKEKNDHYRATLQGRVEADHRPSRNWMI